jgi:hypothetical protein
LIDGVVNGLPVPTRFPPLEASYQSIVVPVPLVALIDTVPVPHLEPGTGLVAAAGTGLTVAVTLVLVEETHPLVVFRATA